MRIVDVHAHYFPTEYLDRLQAYGATMTPVARNLRAGNDPGDIEDRLRMMDDAGVDMQIISAVPQLPYFDDEAKAVAAAQHGNDLYAELVARHPTRFAALAATPLPHGEAAAIEAARAIDELGMRGVTIATSVLDRTLGDPAFEPMWAELDRRAAPVYIHAAGNDCQSPMISEHGLTWIVGAPFEDAIGVLHLLRAGVTARFPNIKFVVAHLGGPLPFLLQRVDDNYNNWGEAFPDLPSKLLRHMWYDTANFHPPGLRCAVDSFGVDRVMLGSDYPYFQDEMYSRAVEYLSEVRFDSDDLDAIYRRTAVELFGLTELTIRSAMSKTTTGSHRGGDADHVSANREGVE